MYVFNYCLHHHLKLWEISLLSKSEEVILDTAHCFFYSVTFGFYALSSLFRSLYLILKVLWVCSFIVLFVCFLLVLPACMSEYYMYCIHVWCQWRPGKGIWAPEARLQTSVCSQVSADNWTQVLLRSGPCSWPWSHQPGSLCRQFNEMVQRNSNKFWVLTMKTIKRN